MIKNLVIGVVAVAVLVAIVLAGLSAYSRKAPEVRSSDARLAPCPGTPNCVSSEAGEGEAAIEPIALNGPARPGWERLTALVREMGGRVIQEDPGYLWASFQTPLFRFIDDLELRLDERNGVVQVRSASRVGYSDRGVNRRRVEELRQRFEAAGGTD